MIVVTGASGFIGSYVVSSLRRRGREVLGVSRYAWRPYAERILGGRAPELVPVDLSNADEVAEFVRARRPEAIIHLDALVDPVALRADPLRALEFNACPALNLLEAARTGGVARFVLASSVAVLPEIQSVPVTASHPLITAAGGPGGGFYGIAKGVSELIALGYSEVFDIDVRIVRPSAVYGFGMQWPIGVKPLVEGLAEGRVVSMPRSGPPRDYTPVQEVAEVFAATLDCVTGDDHVFYAATGRELTTLDGLRAAVRSVFPAGVIDVTDEDQDPTGVESRYRGVLDVGPVRTQLGVAAAFQSLAEGLAVYADDYRRSLRQD